MGKLNEKLLARYYDGALSPKKAKRVARTLEKSPEDQQTLAKMSRMTDLLQLMNEESLSSVSFAGFDKRVAIGVKQNEKTRLGDRVATYISEFFEHRRVIWVPATAVATVALAAIIVIPLVGGKSLAPIAGAPQNEEIWAAGANQTDGSTIESVNSGNSMSQIFENVKDENGNPVGVVWVAETP